MKKIIRKNLVETNVVIILGVLLAVIFWLIYCSFNKSAISESYVFLLAIVCPLVAISIIVSILFLVSKRDRIELYDDRIIEYSDIGRHEYSWANVKEISITKFTWWAGNLIIVDLLASLVMRPFYVNMKLLIENGEGNTEIEFRVSRSFSKTIQQHFNQMKKEAITATV